MEQSLMISQALGFSEVGQRSNNQDQYCPSDEQVAEAGIYVVCDGVGGQARGEVAADLVCQYLPPAIFESEGDYIEALRMVQDRFRDFIAQDPSAHQMSTTVVFVHVLPEGIQLGWIGDSRIYHIRDGEILYRTKDHSMVQTLVDKGEITDEEARTHPMNNVITRAVNSYDELEADTRLLKTSDCEAGDWLFLCTDGVMEAWPDQELAKQFSHDISITMLRERVVERCRERSKDNYTGLILQLDR